MPHHRQRYGGILVAAAFAAAFFAEAPLLTAVRPSFELHESEFSTDSSRRFIWLTDFHLDPFYGTPKAMVHKPGAPCAESNAPVFGASGCGSPVELVKAMLKKASDEQEETEFLLYSGDYQRHYVENATEHLWETFSDVIETTRGLFLSAFPSTGRVHMVPTILVGNNDFIPDYFVNATSDLPYSYNPDDTEARMPDPYLLKVAELWKPDLSEEEFGSFAHGGYLSRTLQPGLTLIVLNTVMYSSKAQGTAVGFKDPFGQLRWLESQLATIRETGGAAYIHGHIPPIYDSYGLAPMMQPEYSSKLLGLFSSYSDVIAALLFGHVHDNEMRAVPGMPDSSPPLLVHASTAPCFGNAPFLSRVTFDRVSKRLMDLEANFVDLSSSSHATIDDGPKWTKLFDSVLNYFSIASLSNAEARRLALRMATNDKLFSKYRDEWMYGVAQAPCQGICRASVICLISDGFYKPSLDSCISAQTSIPKAIQTL